MEGRQGPGRKDFEKPGLCAKQGGQKKDVCDFDQFRGLKRNAAYGKRKPGTVCQPPQDQHQRQRPDPAGGIDSAVPPQHGEFSHHKGNKHGQEKGNRRDHKLPDRPIRIDSGQYDHAGVNKHTHGVEQNQVRSGINQDGKHQYRQRQNRHKRIQNQIRKPPGPNPDGPPDGQLG